MDLKEFFITPEGLSDHDLKELEEKKSADWSAAGEGQLAVDVYQTDKSVVIKSAIAGVLPKDIDISISGDILTIRGTRSKDHEVNDGDYYYRECYWGSFSRSIVLPVEVKQDQIEAVFKNGILTVILPKTKPHKMVNIRVEE
ncbi:MAG: Hsp20/alpha crystallin family protein [Patescibacteria group bacterium]